MCKFFNVLRVLMVCVLMCVVFVGCAYKARYGTAKDRTAAAKSNPPATVSVSNTTYGNSLKNIDANTGWLNPTITADLTVSPNKIVGVASGRRNMIKEIEKLAIADALVKHNSGRLDKDIADLMVEPTYFYENDGLGNIKITVLGYPAKYVNFRNVPTPLVKFEDTSDKRN